MRRAFAGVDLADLDPFVHLDQMGEVEYAPGEPKGTPWHPHRGFETVTYMIDGTFEHQDSNGGGGVITNGDTQWMTAGAGILHIEKPPEWLVVSGGPLPRLPALGEPAAGREMGASRDIRTCGPTEVALVSSPDGGALVRIIAGEIAGHKGPGSTYTPITLAHATLSPGARLTAALAGRLQRPRLRDGRARLRGCGGAADRDRAAGRLRARRRHHRRPPRRSRRVAARTWSLLILGGRPIASPWPGWARS